MSRSSENKPDTNTYAVALAAMAFFAVFLFFPLAYVFKKSFIVDGGFSLAFFKLLAGNPVIKESLLNSIKIGVYVTVASSLTGFLLAFMIARTDLPFKGLWGSLALAPMIMPPFVGAIGVKYIFGRFGMVNSILMLLGVIDVRSPVDWLGSPFWGVVALETLHLFPIMYLNIVGAFSLIDPSIEEAARGLGSRGLRLFGSVILPLLAPGFFAGASIVFIWAFTDLGTPLLMEFRSVAPVQIFDNVMATKENLIGYALVVVTLGITTVFFLSAKFLFGRRRYEMPAFGRAASTPIRLNIPAKIFSTALIALVMLIALLPHISVVLISISKDWFMTALPAEWTTSYYHDIFNYQTAYTSIRNSLFLSGMTVVLALIIGGAVARILARKKFFGRDFLDMSAMLPLAVPGVALAFGYVQCFFGTALDPQVNPVPLLIVSYTIRRLPLVVRALYAGFLQASVTFEEVSASLGASPGSTLFRVTFPLIRSNMLGAAILAFSFSMLEVSDSMILAMQEKFYPMTKAIFSLISRLEDASGLASAMGVIGVLILAIGLLSAQRLIGRRMGDLFKA